jgi:hypothetical protein
MKRIGWVVYCAVIFSLGLPGGNIHAQFGGGDRKAARTNSAKEELRSAIDRAERMMGGASQGEAAAKMLHDSCKCVGETPSPAVEKIEQALRGPLHSTGVDFSETPLNDVVTALQDDYGIPIQLDTPAMDENGISSDEPVTVNLHNISLRSALRLMLKHLNLTYVIQDEVLLITTPQQGENRLKVCVYDIRDFADASQPKAVQALVDAIVSCVATETWASNGGGNGDIRPLPPNLLVISQTQAVHEEIRSLLFTIREMRQLPAPDHPVREPEPAKGD